MSFGKTIARKLVFPAITSLGIEKMFSISSKNCYSVLEYHGVTTSVDAALNGRHMDAVQFEKHLKYFRRNFDIVPLKEIYRYRQEGIRPKRKTIALTFDDGYRNNYNSVFPLLVKYNIPATFFIITASFNEDNFVVWPDIFDIVYRYSPLSQVVLGEYEFIRNGGAFYSNKLGMSLFDWVKRLGDERESILNDFKKTVDFTTLLQQVPTEHWQLMGKKQIIEVFQSGLVEIGSHTHLHYNLGNIPLKMAQEELAISKAKLEDIIKSKVNTICYPDGSYNKEIKSLSGECGYTNLIAVDYKLPEDKTDKSIMARHCISNTTTFESNIIQIHSSFRKDL
jgi:peptidoglycan/xylan/chitin deacetylase (PgdA/CDA1 family)